MNKKVEFGIGLVKAVLIEEDLEEPAKIIEMILKNAQNCLSAEETEEITKIVIKETEITVFRRISPEKIKLYQKERDELFLDFFREKGSLCNYEITDMAEKCKISEKTVRETIKEIISEDDKICSVLRAWTIIGIVKVRHAELTKEEKEWIKRLLVDHSEEIEKTIKTIG